MTDRTREVLDAITEVLEDTGVPVHDGAAADAVPPSMWILPHGQTEWQSLPVRGFELTIIDEDGGLLPVLPPPRPAFTVTFDHVDFEALNLIIGQGMRRFGEAITRAGQHLARFLEQLDLGGYGDPDEDWPDAMRWSPPYRMPTDRARKGSTVTARSVGPPTNGRPPRTVGWTNTRGHGGRHPQRRRP